MNIVQELAGHVKDGTSFHFPFGIHPEIPEILTNIGITKYVVLQMLVASAMVAVFIPMAAKMRGGQPVKGRFWNMIEAILVYLKDSVIVPAIGSAKDAAPYVPYLWTLFFFILFCNLLGMVPGFGTATSAITVTATLAICTLVIVTATGIIRHGPIGFWTGMVPHMEGKLGPVNIATVLGPFLFILEVFSFFLKHCTLCIRLMATMFGGHLMLAVFFAFIPMAAASAFYLFASVTILSLFAALAVSFLELLIACLQAYVFTFLTSIYIGMAIHQH
ncbi:MAG: F0F1 ATP synthase subunit A [Planctomycetaceae bacterium]|nr:F0F1 ATP synthase subunit A [Planctomycetaceae bacterium]